ncbi:ABC transporter substrate-binding protein [Halococcus agarilyticus]|uniref:ABC transporter substrate-binding protein n=1 Tax=Halococcus agarilyticus TaxID=1232219 RepID=UPI00067762E1|nr:sugar ABC transporter substrate-binding protein [Halococcus agarilyticus]
MTTTLRLLARPFDGFERALDRQIQSFKATSGADIEIERDHRPLPEIHGTYVENERLAEGEYDLFLCLSDWLPSAVERGLVDSLDDRLEADPPIDWSEGWAESMVDLVTYERTTYGVPYHDGPEVFFYRNDLFESAAEQRAFRAEYGRSLTVPRTWNQFLEVADFFTRPEDDLWGTVVAALPDGHNNVYDFLIQLWSRGGQVFDEDRSVAFDSETGVEALQFYHDLVHEHEVAPPESLDMESVESGRFFADGNAAMMWNWSGFGAMAEDSDSDVFGRVNYGLIPRLGAPEGRHASLTALYGLTIPSAARRPDLAYDFIRHTASPEMDLVTTEEGGSGTRLSTWRDPKIQKQEPFYSVIEEVNTGSVNTLPQISEYVEFNDILNRAVERVVVEQSATPEEALTEAARETRRLLES